MLLIPEIIIHLKKAAEPLIITGTHQVTFNNYHGSDLDLPARELC